jgi:hypothetical protein
MVAMADAHERFPVAQAEQVIADRVSAGSLVLGIEGLWVAENEVRADINYIADFSPNGLGDVGEITEVLQSWPRDESFCVEILFITHP